MKKLNLPQSYKNLSKIGLFIIILAIGSFMALAVGETAGLALADLSNASVAAITETAYGDALYAALDSNKNARPKGIYRSDDNGRSWLMVSAGPEVAINALAVHPANKQILYAGTRGGLVSEDSPTLSGGSLWYSSDEGQTWDQYRLRLPINADRNLPAVNVLTVDPNHPGVLYVGTDGQGLYRFQVGQEGYELIGGVAMRNLYVKNIIPANDGRLYALATTGLYVINSNALHKIESLPDLAVSLTVDPSNTQTLYVGTIANGTYRSTDGGKNWTAINTGLSLQPGLITRVSAIAIDEDNPSHLALATSYQVGSHTVGGEIYESTTTGDEWVKLGSSEAVVNHLTIKEGGVYVATNNSLVRYGPPLVTTSLWSWLRIQPIVNPIAIQLIILALTINLAAWILGGYKTKKSQQLATATVTNGGETEKI